MELFSEEERKLIKSHLLQDSNEKRIMGFKLNELVIVVTFIFGVIAFYIRTDETVKKLTSITDYLVEFTNNSDNYHSTATGLQFKQGKPVSYWKLSDANISKKE